jgi:hypothetical protein
MRDEVSVSSIRRSPARMSIPTYHIPHTSYLIPHTAYRGVHVEGTWAGTDALTSTKMQR